MSKQMAIRCHGSSIYIALSITLFTGCKGNVNLPPDKVVGKEQVIRTSTAQTVHNQSDTQQDTATKVIAREREQVGDEVPIPPQDNRSQTQKNTDTKAIKRAREQADDVSHPDDLQEDIYTDAEASDTEIERTLTTSMLYSRDMESAHSSDDGNTEQDYAALNVSTEEDKDVLDQLEQDVVHDAHTLMLGIPGSTQE